MYVLKGYEIIVQSGFNIFCLNFFFVSKMLVVFVYKDGNRSWFFLKYWC